MLPWAVGGPWDAVPFGAAPDARDDGPRAWTSAAGMPCGRANWLAGEGTGDRGLTISGVCLKKPPATGHRPPATGHRPPATGHRPPATGHRPPATGHRCDVRPAPPTSAGSRRPDARAASARVLSFIIPVFSALLAAFSLFAAAPAQAQARDDATLSRLSAFQWLNELSAGSDSIPFLPAFDAAKTSYVLDVHKESTHVNLKLRAGGHPSARVKVGKRAGVTGLLSQRIALDGPETVIPIKVTAADGTTTKTYTLTLKRVDEIVLGYDTDPRQAYSSSTVEGAGKVRVPVTVSALPAAGSLAVTVTAKDITAESGKDYACTACAVTFRPTDTTRTRFVELSVTDDSAVEPVESFSLEASISGSTATHRIPDAGARAYISIADNDGPSSLSGKTFSVTRSVSVKEGARAVLDVMLGEAAPTGGLAFSVTPAFDAGDGRTRAASSADAGPVPSTVTVPAGRRTARLSIPIAADGLAEPDEHFTVSIATAAQGWTAAAGGNAAHVIILGAEEVVNAPENITATSDGNAISVRWTPRADARAYHVRYRRIDYYSSSAFGQTWNQWEWTTDAFRTIAPVVQLGQYQIQVRTVAGTAGQGRAGRWSEPVRVLVPLSQGAVALSAPANLSVTNLAVGGIVDYALILELDSVAGATGYEVHYTSAPASAVPDDAPVSGTADETQAWVDHGLFTSGGIRINQITNIGVETRVRVRAVNGEAKSPWTHGSGVAKPGLSWISSHHPMFSNPPIRDGMAQIILSETTGQAQDCSSGCRKRQAVQLSSFVTGANAVVRGVISNAGPRYAPAGPSPASLADDLPSGHALPVAGGPGKHFSIEIALPLDDGENEADETYTITLLEGRWHHVRRPSAALVTIRDINPPAAPSAVSLTSGDGLLTAAWSKPDGPVTAYGLRYKASSAPDRDASTPGDPSTGWVAAPGSLTNRVLAVTGLANGTAYDVQVRATDGQAGPGNGWGAWSSSHAATPGPLAADASPAPVSGLSATPGSGRLDLAWTAPQGPVTGYDVDWTTSAAVAEDAAVQSGAAPSAADGWVDGGHAGVASAHALSGLAGGVRHRVRVRAVNANGSGPWVTGAGTPVDGRAAVAFAQREYTFAEGAETQALELALDRAAPEAGRGTVTFADGTATAGADYRAADAAIDIATGDTAARVTWAGIEDDANEATETVTATLALDSASAGAFRAGAPATATIRLRDNDPPLAPSGLTLTPGDRTLTARWTKPPGPVRHYIIRYRQSGIAGDGRADEVFLPTRGVYEDPATGWAQDFVAGTSALLGTFENTYVGILKAGQAYEVEVRAHDGQYYGAGNGWGPFSERVTGVATGRPAAPSGLKVTAGHDRLDLAWSVPDDAVNGWEVHYTSATVAADAPAGGSDPSAGWVAVRRSGTAAAQAITRLANGRTYRVRVRGVNGAFAGPWAFGTGTPADRRIAVSLDPDATKEYREGAASGISLDAVLDRIAERDLPAAVSAGGGTATAGEDYTLGSGTVAFPVRTDRAKVTLSLPQDAVNEAHETVTVAIRPDLSSDADLRQGDPSSLEVTILDDDPPAAPAGLAVQPGFRRLTATWTKPAGPVSRYQVRYKLTFAPDRNGSGNNPRSGWLTLSSTGTSTSRAIAESDGIERTQRTYDVQVRADDGQAEAGNGWGPWSANVKAKPSTSQEGTNFAAPTSLAVTEGHAQLRLSWQAVARIVVRSTEAVVPTGYDVHYTASASATVAADAALSGDAATGWADAGHAGAGTAIAIAGLANGQEYRIRIRATNAAEGLAGPWATVTGTPTDPFLESLTLLSGGGVRTVLSVSALGTPFAPETLAYKATVPALHDSARVVAVPRDPTARIRAGVSEASLAPLAGGLQSRTFSLDYGTGNAIVVEVTDGNGAKRVYKVDVTRVVDIGFEPGKDVTVREKAGTLSLALGPRIAWDTAGTLRYRPGAARPATIADDLGSLATTFATTASGSRLASVAVPVTGDGANEEHETFIASIATRPQDGHLAVRGDRGAVAVTIMDDDPPAAPGDFEVAWTGGRAVATWTKPAGPVTGYELRYEQSGEPVGPATTPGDPTTGRVTLSLPGTATSAELTGLVPWTPANADLRATDGQAPPGNGWGARALSTLVLTGPPQAPAGLAADGYTLGGVGANGAIDLEWNHDGGQRITGYDVHYTASATAANDAGAGADPATGWAAVDRSEAGVRASERITGLVAGSAYRVRVRGVNDIAPGAWAFARATAADQRPSVRFDAAARSVAEGGRVQGLAQLTGLSGAVDSELRARIAAADGTAVHGEDHSFDGADVVFAVNGAKEKAFAFDLGQDTANEPDETFTLTLVPATAGGLLRAGTPSSMTVTILDDDPPAAPGGFVATAGDRSLALSWTKPPGPVDSYMVSWKTADAADADATTAGDPATGWVARGVSGQATSMTISGLVNGQEYSLRILADDGQAGGSNGEGTAASASGTPAGVPSAPTGLSLKTGSGRLNLSWTAPAGPVTGYDVHYTYSASAGAAAAAGGNPLAGWVAASRTESDPPATTQAITGLLNQTVRVRVRAKNGDGAGPWAAGGGDPRAVLSTVRFSGSIDSVEVTEGEAAKGISVEATRRPEQTRQVSAVVAAVPGTAGAADYSVSPLSLPIAAGARGKVAIGTIMAGAAKDAENEADETFTVTLAPGALSRDQLGLAPDYRPVTVTIKDADPPAAPAGVTLRQIRSGRTTDPGGTERSVGRFAVSWDKPPGPVAEYEVQYTVRTSQRRRCDTQRNLQPNLADADNPAKGWVTLASPGTATSLAGPDNLLALCTYEARVRARDGQAKPGNGWGPWSAVAEGSIILDAQFETFSAPTSLLVTPGDARLTLTWAAVPAFLKPKAESDPVTLSATGYDVHYTASAAVAADAALSGNALTGWADAGHAGTGTEQAVTGLTNGREYRLRVRATNAAEGLAGPWASVTGSPVSGDNALSGLLIEYRSGGSGAFVGAPLSPAFAPDVTAYDAYVPQFASVRVVPTARGNGAFIGLNNLSESVELPSGGASKAVIPFNPIPGRNGDVPWRVFVAAKNDPMRDRGRTYTVTLRVQPYLSFSGGAAAPPPLGELAIAEAGDSPPRFTLSDSILRNGVAVALDHAGSGTDPASPDDDLEDGYTTSLQSVTGVPLYLDYPVAVDDALNEAHETFTIAIRDSPEHIRRAPSAVTIKIVDNDPPAPPALVLTQGDADVAARWEKPAGPVTRYELRYKAADAPDAAATAPDDPLTGWVTRALPGTALSTTFAGLVPALVYDVQARADDGQAETGNGWGGWSATVSTPLGPPGAVTGIRARTGTGHAQADRLDLAWVAPPGTVTGYDVHYTSADAAAASDAAAVLAGNSPDPAAGWVAADRGTESDPPAVVQAIGGLGVGTRYRVRVRAKNGNGLGPWAFGAGAPVDQRHVLQFDSDALTTLDGAVVLEEDGNSLRLPAELDRRPFRALGATAEFADGTAALGTDFTVASSAFAFAPDQAAEPGGEVVSEIAVAPVDNDANDEDRTFTVTLAPDATSVPYMRLGEPSTVTVRILDDDPPSAPGGFAATPGDRSLILSWTKPPGPVDGYVIGYRTAEAPDRESIDIGDPTTGIVVAGEITDGTSESFTLSGLRNGQGYVVLMRAYEGSGDSNDKTSEIVTADGTPAGPPPAVTGLAVTPGLYSLGLAWSKPFGPVTGYDVHYTTAAAGDVADADAASGSDAAAAWIAAGRGTESEPPALSQTINGLANGLAVRVRVRAKNGEGAGAWAFGAGTPADGRPALRFADEDGRVAVSEGQGTATLQAELDRRPGRNLAATATFKDATAVTGTDYTVSDAAFAFRSDATPGANGEVSDNVAFALVDNSVNGPDRTFTVTVAPDAASEPYMRLGTPTQVTVTILDNDPPGAPTGVKFRAHGTSLDVQWTAPAGPVAGYQVRYRTPSAPKRAATTPGDPSTGWVVLESAGSAASLVIAGLTDGAIYQVQVRASDGQAGAGNGWGPWTAEERAVTTRNPNFTFAAPSGLAAAAGDARLDVSWTAPPDYTPQGAQAAVTPAGYDVHYTSFARAPVRGAGTLAQLVPDGDPDKGWADAGHTGTATSQAITGLANGQEYRVRVRATAAGQDPGDWAEATATPKASDSSISFRVLAREAGSGTWSEQALREIPVLDQLTAEVSHRTARIRIVAEVTDGDATLAAGEDSEDLKPVTLVEGVARIDRDLPPGQGSANLDTFFQVTAQDGSKGAVRWIYVNRLPEPPSAPRDFSATAGDGEASLAWRAPATGFFNGYFLSYTSAPATELADDAASSGSGTDSVSSAWVTVTPGDEDVSRTISGLTNGKEHRFRLRAAAGSQETPTVFAKATPLSSETRLTGLKLQVSADGGTTFAEQAFLGGFDRAATGDITLADGDDADSASDPLFAEHTHARLVATWDAPGTVVKVGRGAAQVDASTLAPVQSGAESAAFALGYGDQRLFVKVTAGNGDERTYKVLIKRLREVGFEPAEATIAEGGGPAELRLGPSTAFDTSGTLAYAPGGTDPAAIADDLGESRPTKFRTTAAGGRLETVQVPVTDDGANEADETFTVTLAVTAPQDVPAHRTRKAATVTITDDDPPAAPADLALTPGMEKLAAAWTKPAGPVTGYALRYRARGAPDAEAAPADDPETGWVTLAPAGTATAAEIAGLAAGTDYRVQVRATDGQAAPGNGWGSWSPARTAAPEGPPAGPSDLGVEARDGLSGALDLSWTAPDGAVTRYDVHYTTSAAVAPDADVQSGEAPLAADGWVDAGHNGTATRATVAGLAVGTSHFLRVRAANAQGASAWEFASGTPRDLRRVLSFEDAAPEISEGDSATLAAVLDKAPLRTLKGRMRFADGSATQGVDYSAAAADLDFLEGGALAKAVPVATVQNGANEDHETFTATISVPAAYEAFMRTGAPTEVTVTLLDDDPPAAPSGLAVTRGYLKLSAEWTKPDGPVTGYQLRYRQRGAPNRTAATAGDPATGWVTLTPSGTGTSAEIAGEVLVGFVPYEVQVRATDGQDAADRRGNGYGDWSASVTATPRGPPGAPGGFAATAAHERLHVSWTKPAGRVNQYELDYTSSVTVARDAPVLPGGSAASSGWIRAGENAGPLTFLGGSLTERTLGGLDNGTEYRVRLRARNSGGGAGPWAMLRAIPGDTRIEVAFGEAAHEVAEAAGSGSVAAGVAAPLARDALDVAVTFGDGTATGGTDYASSGSGAFMLSRGETSGTASFTVADDAENEAHETFAATISLDSADLDDYRPGAAATVTLLDDDPPAAPTGLALVAGAAGLGAQWTQPDGPVAGYELRYRTEAAPEDDATTEGDPATGWVTLAPSGAGTSAVIAGLTASIVHVVQVRATDGQAAPGNGWGDWSAAVAGVPPGPPSVPTGLAAAGGHERLDLSWTAPPGAVTGYDVHYTSAETGAVADDKAASGSDASAGWVAASRTGKEPAQEIAGLANGTSYRVRVRAANGDGESAWVHGSGTPADNRPSASWDAASAGFAEGADGTVTAVLDAAPDRNLGVTLIWVETAADGSERVLREAPLTFTAAGGARVPVPVTSEANTENDADETYAIRMSVDAASAPYLKIGTPSQVAVTIQDDDPPAAPTLTLTPGGGALTASWTKPAGPVTGYELQYKTGDARDADASPADDPSTGWVTVDPGGTATSFLIGDLTQGSEYDVKVRANDGQTAFGDGWGDWSETVTDSPDRPADSFAAPTGLMVVAGDGALDLSWTPPPALLGDGGFGANPTGYDVHYTSAASGIASDDADVQDGPSPDPAAGWVAVRRVADTSPTELIGGLDNATAYRVRVRARNALQNIFGAWVTGAGTPLSPVATLSELTVSTGSGGAFVERDLHNDNDRAARTAFAPSVTAYRVFAIPPDELARVRVRITSAAAKATVNGAALASGTWSKGIALDVGANNTVTVRVTAQDGGVQSYALRVVRPPEAPTGLQVTAGDAELELSWTAPSGTVDGYDVHYTSAGSGAVADGAEASGNDASKGWVAAVRNGVAATQTLSGLENGERHRVRVRAVRAGAASAWTAEAATPKSGDTALADGSPTLKTATEDGAFAAAELTDPAMPGDPFLAEATDLVRARVAANANDADATVTVNGTALARDAESAAIPLDYGFTDITVQVTAENGDTEDHVVRVPRKLVVGFKEAAIEVAEGAGAAKPVLGDPDAGTHPPFDAEIALDYTFGGGPASASAADLGSGRPAEVTAAAGDSVPFAFDVPIEDDGLNEEDESLRITLQQPSGSHATVDSARNAVEITIKDNDPPAAPSGLALTPGAQKLAAAWTKPAGPVTGYQLRYRTADAGDADARDGDPSSGWVTQEVSDTSGTPPQVVTSAEIAGLDAAKAYEVRVRATDGQAASGNGWGDWSAAADETPDGPPPVPTDLVAVPGHERLDLTWTAPLGSVTGYDVYYTTKQLELLDFLCNNNSALPQCDSHTPFELAASGKASDGWVDAEHTGTEAEHRIDSLVYGTTYRLMVRAVNASGAGPAILVSSGLPDSRGAASLSEAAARIAEGDTLLLAVELDQAPKQWLPVLLNPADGTASATDYTVGTDAAQFRGDVVSQSFTVAAADDDVNEADETFSVALAIEAPHDERYKIGSAAKVEVTIADDDPPAAPGGLSVTDGEGELTVRWTAPDGPVTGYEIRYRTAAAAEADATTPGDPATGWVTQAAPGAGTQATIAGLANGTQYAVQVRATDGQAAPGNGWGPWSASQTGNVLARPGAVRGLSAVPDNRIVILQWDNPAAGTVSGYDIHYTRADAVAAPDDAEPGTVPAAGWAVSVENLGGATSIYAVEKLENGYDHRFRVRARNSAGPGPWSHATAMPGPYQYSLDLAAVAGDGEIVLSWTVEDGLPAADHDIHYTSAPESGEGAVADDAAVQSGLATGWVQWRTGSANQEDTIDGLENGTEYRVRVRGRNAAGGGPWASAGPVTPLSSDATLSALALKSGAGGDDATFADGTLAPAFASSVTAYASGFLPMAHEQAKVIATASDAGATVEVGLEGGTLAEVESGEESGVFALGAVDTGITVRVTAQNHTEADPNVTEYTVTVRRQVKVGFAKTALTFDESSDAVLSLGEVGRAVMLDLDYGAPDGQPAGTAAEVEDLESGFPRSATTAASGASTIVVPIEDDMANEKDEVFTVTMSLASGEGGAVIAEGSKTVTVTITDNDRPASPALTLTPGDGKITASWTKPDGPVTSYAIRIRQQGGGAYTRSNIGSADTLTKSFTGLKAGTVYEVGLQAVNSLGGSRTEFSPWASATATTVGPPPATTDLKAKPGRGRLDLTWTAPLGPVTGYEVFYTTDATLYSRDFNAAYYPDQNPGVTPFELAASGDPSDGWVAVDRGTESDPPATTQTIDGLDYLEAPQYYYLAVRAVNGSGAGLPAGAFRALPDTRRTLSFGAASATIREGRSATLTATLDATPGRYLAAGLDYGGGTATEVLDYKAGPASVAFPKDTENLDVPLVVGSVFDTLNEADETFTVALEVGSAYELHLKAVAPAEVTLTIADDDPPAAPADLALKPGVSELAATWTKPDGPVTGVPAALQDGGRPGRGGHDARGPVDGLGDAGGQRHRCAGHDRRAGKRDRTRGAGAGHGRAGGPRQQLGGLVGVAGRNAARPSGRGAGCVAAP